MSKVEKCEKVSKPDLIKMIRGKCNDDGVVTVNSDDQAAAILNSVIESIRGVLNSGKGVVIQGFGTFEVAERASRNGRNPRTNEAIVIPAAVGPKFVFADALKASVKESVNTSK
jgi:nucleoid DNA-binding protein